MRSRYRPQLSRPAARTARSVSSARHVASCDRVGDVQSSPRILLSEPVRSCPSRRWPRALPASPGVGGGRETCDARGPRPPFVLARVLRGGGTSVAPIFRHQQSEGRASGGRFSGDPAVLDAGSWTAASGCEQKRDAPNSEPPRVLPVRESGSLRSSQRGARLGDHRSPSPAPDPDASCWARRRLGAGTGGRLLLVQSVRRTRGWRRAGAARVLAMGSDGSSRGEFPR